MYPAWTTQNHRDDNRDSDQNSSEPALGFLQSWKRTIHLPSEIRMRAASVVAGVIV